MRNLNQKRLPSRLQQQIRPIFLGLFLVLFTSLGFGYDATEYESQNNDIPAALKEVGITEKLGAQLHSLNLDLVDEDGKKQPLQSFLTRGRPVLLTLVYYSCPSLCNLHLNGVFDVLKQLSLVPGKDYELVAVSFDARETADLAAAKKITYQEKYSFAESGTGIHFLTGDENSLKTLADTIGFKYKWDDKAKEWAHASAAVVVTPEGSVSRYLHGVFFEPKTFRLSIVEASKGKIGDIVDSVMLFCFRYDPKANKYALYAFNLMRAGAAAAVILVMIWLIPFWLRQSRKRKT